MHIENWSAVSEIFDAAMELPAETRDSFIRETAESEEIAVQVLRLVRAAEHETGFLATNTDGRINEREKIPSGTRLGNWRIEKPLGSGGMGEVYLVNRADGLYDQTAALKLIASTNPNAWERFSRERQILATLEHPGIGRLIDGGISDDGRPFLVMEHVDGVSITDYAESKELSLRQKLYLFLDVCEALTHAHGRLILHRDIKPGNILVSGAGICRLIDFGVAALLGAHDEDLGAPMTLRYAAPEQFQGQPVSVETDIFGLCATLHELLTGHAPERHGLTIFIDTQAIPKELAAILKKGLNERPSDRYSSAEALVADIESYLEKKPVDAFNGGTGYKLSKFFARYRAASILTGALILALSAGVVSTIMMTIRAREATALAEDRAAALETAFHQNEIQRQIAVASRNTFRGVTREAIAEENQDKSFSDILDLERDAAIRQFETEPERASATLYSLAEMYLTRGDIAKVMETLKPIVDNARDVQTTFTVPSIERYAMFQAFSGETDASRENLDLALEFMSEQPQVYATSIALLGGRRAELLGDPELMRKSVDELVVAASKIEWKDDASRQRYVELMDQAGYMSVVLGDNERGIEIIEATMAANGEIKGQRELRQTVLMNNLVGLYQRVGDLEKAMSMNERLIAELAETLGPSADLGLAYRMRGSLLSQLGEHDVALEALNTAIPLFEEYDINDSDILVISHMDIAREIALKGDLDAAFTHLSDIRNQFSHVFERSKMMSGMYFERRAEFMEMAGNEKKARADFERAVADLTEFANRPDLLARVQEKLDALNETSLPEE